MWADASVALAKLMGKQSLPDSYLWLDQDQVYEKNDKIMLNVFIAEATAVATNSQSNIVSAGLVSCSGILGP